MNLSRLNHLFIMLISCAMLTSYALSIEFHIILVIVLMTIQVFYISIIFYKLLPMFMIHVSCINIALSFFTCFIYQYRFISFYMFHAYIFQRSGYGKRLYLPEGTITVYDSDLYLYYNV